MERLNSLIDYRITVLLIDDQPIVAEQVRRMISIEDDMVFHYCQEPSVAINMALKIKPTIILLDLLMPKIDGITLTKYIRANKDLKNIPLIVLSSKEEASTKAKVFAVGANDYLVKLPDKIELLARIRYHSRGYISFLERNDAYLALEKSQKALKDELNNAAEYVRKLLPEPIDTDILSTDWKFEPSEQLGGDCFGYHWLDKTNFAMYLIDVCGHGVGSALLSISVINILRSFSLRETDFSEPSSVLSNLNKKFQMANHNNMYFTMWYGVFNTLNRTLNYASAGHPPAFLCDKNNITELMSQNFIVGGIPDFCYSSDKIQVNKESKLFIYSDGVYEILKEDGTMWSFQEFSEYINFVARNSNDEKQKLFEHVKLMNNSEKLDDDFSFLKVFFK